MIESRSHFRGFETNHCLSLFSLCSCVVSLMFVECDGDDDIVKCIGAINVAAFLTFVLVGRGAAPVAVAPLPPRRVLVVDVHRYAGVELRAALRTASIPIKETINFKIKSKCMRNPHNSLFRSPRLRAVAPATVTQYIHSDTFGCPKRSIL